jgi:hypothetical protein
VPRSPSLTKQGGISRTIGTFRHRAFLACPTISNPAPNSRYVCPHCTIVSHISCTQFPSHSLPPFTPPHTLALPDLHLTLTFTQRRSLKDGSSAQAHWLRRVRKESLIRRRIYRSRIQLPLPSYALSSPAPELSQCAGSAILGMSHVWRIWMTAGSTHFIYFIISSRSAREVGMLSLLLLCDSRRLVLSP